MREPAPKTFGHRVGGAFVAARQDGNTATGLLEGAGKFFDNRRLAGAADGEVADADDLTTERVVAEDAVAPEEVAELDDLSVDFREDTEDAAGDARSEIAASFKDDVEHVLLDIFRPPPHGRS